MPASVWHEHGNRWVQIVMKKAGSCNGGQISRAGKKGQVLPELAKQRDAYPHVIGY